MRWFRYVLMVLTVVFSPVVAQPEGIQPTVILISIDGFRYDYLEKTSCPNLQSLAQTGVKAKWLIPIFPSKTFPNHYTIVTGLYSEHHGIVGNTMYDPAFDATFAINKADEVTNARWWGGEPLWVTAEQQGRISATYFWPGSEAAIKGVRPRYWKKYDGRVSEEERVRQILQWLDLPPAERPAFLSLYFEAVDHAGHRYGPAYSSVDTAVAIVDRAVGTLLDGLRERNILQAVNIVVVSDHGMSPVEERRSIYLDRYLDLQSISSFDPVVGSIWIRDEQVDEVYSRLKEAHPHLMVYKKNEIPDRWHYRNHRRIGPILLVADDGWTITRSGERSSWWGRMRGGDHGYDNQSASMRAMFIARGPAFLEGATVEPFENIEIYNLLCRILGLRPAPNDGELTRVEGMLKR